MANGFWNRILRVDLSTGKTWEEHPTDEFYRQHVGGRSFIAHYLLKEVAGDTDPLGPDNLPDLHGRPGHRHAAARAPAATASAGSRRSRAASARPRPAASGAPS